MADICGAEHPTERDLTCEMPPGTNAYNDDRGENVHVHKARRGGAEPAVFRWEDE
jgi:hypothetical protein